MNIRDLAYCKIWVVILFIFIFIHDVCINIRTLLRYIKKLLKRFNLNFRRDLNRCLNNNCFKWLKSSVVRCSRVINIYSRTSNLNRSNDSWNLLIINHTMCMHGFFFYLRDLKLKRLWHRAYLILTSNWAMLSRSCINKSTTYSWP